MKALSVENISKKYRLGLIGSGSLREDFRRFAAKIAGKEDPTLKVGQRNSLTNDNKHQVPSTKHQASEYIWALKDINFDVKQGEVLGIIGKNGAGKSTLLKILSKVTLPTSGQIRVQGRVASLLEVGTGFHPELTGRENIFLNGAILGMTKSEIKSKFDEIVDFSGISKYIDTPVKRYSSGMYVRLAFAVAAHLEPEILIIDEVLAVGDVDFQQKCLGKMKDVSRSQGRTVLFVSHNLTAISSLCDNVILLEQGMKIMESNAQSVIDFYLQKSASTAVKLKRWSDGDKGLSKNDNALFRMVEIRSERNEIRITDDFSIYLEFEFLKKFKNIHISLAIYTIDGICVLNSKSQEFDAEKTLMHGECFFPKKFLNEGLYSLRVLLIEDNTRVLIDVENLITFKIDEEMTDSKYWYAKWIGIVRPELKWKTT